MVKSNWEKIHTEAKTQKEPEGKDLEIAKDAAGVVRKTEREEAGIPNADFEAHLSRLLDTAIQTQDKGSQKEVEKGINSLISDINHLVETRETAREERNRAEIERAKLEKRVNELEKALGLAKNIAA